MYRIFLLTLTMAFFTWGCNSNKNISNKENNKESTEKANSDAKPPKCNTYGTVVDHTGLDGCKFLIHLEDGRKLLPAEMMNKDFQFKDKQRIHFSYSEIEGGMSICMAENAMVKIYCIEEVKGEKEDKCVDTVDPLTVRWMSDLIKRKQIDIVYRYEYEGRPAYFFRILRCCDFQSPLYDCEGTRLCVSGGITGGNCDYFFKKLSKKKLIYGKEPNDK